MHNLKFPAQIWSKHTIVAQNYIFNEMISAVNKIQQLYIYVTKPRLFTYCWNCPESKRMQYLSMNFLILLTAINLASSSAHLSLQHNSPVGALLNSTELEIYSLLTEQPNFMPSFPQNCSEEAQKQFLEIFKDGSATAEIMKENEKKWLESQDSQVQVTFLHLWNK